jgi:hypothetical protein
MRGLIELCNVSYPKRNGSGDTTARGVLPSEGFLGPTPTAVSVSKTAMLAPREEDWRESHETEARRHEGRVN